MRKALLTIVVSSLLLVCAAGSALAGSVYLDLVPGKWNIDIPGNSLDDDANGVIVGVEHLFNESFKGGFEYSSYKCKESGDDYDYTGFDINGGYLFTEYFAVTAGYHNHELDLTNGIKLKTTGFMLGADADFLINEKSKINSSIAFSVNGNAELVGADADANIFIGKVKYIYALNEQWDLSAGYRYTSYDINNLDLKINGISLGVAYKF
jgi:opacity protein-like surface antigen